MVSPAERAVLDRLVRARTSEQRLAQRARIVIPAADGVANKRIAAELGVNLMTVLCGAGASRPNDCPACATRHGQDEHRPTPGRTVTG